MWSVVLCVVLAAAACGPSTAEIQTAKLATYQGSPAELYDIAEATAAETYKIGDTDRSRLVFATQPQWYSPEGMRQSAGAGNFVNLDDRSVMLMLIVEVVTGHIEHAVVVTPKTFQNISGSPKPRELAPDDPNLPGWIPGRVDALQLDIYKRAQHMVSK